MNSLPSELLQSLQNVKGFDEEAFITVHQSGAQITSVRLNPRKSVCCSKVSPFGGDLEGAVPWCKYGYYLPERPSFTLDPLFHAGAYYVQEASSMFLEEALRQTVALSQPLKVLDLCAAPGGKSTLIQSLISSNSLLVSNEVIKTRVNILSENMTKWGAANVIVTNNDPKDFQRLENYFDVVVVDAPCSGSGLFRKDPVAVSEWSEQNVQLCSQRQRRILADVLPALKTGGVLIYSTCSYSPDEDESIADWLVQEVNAGSPNVQLGSLQLTVKKEWGIVETASERSGSYGYRFYPDKIRGEGFFIAAFRKSAVVDKMREPKNQKSNKKEAGVIPKEIELLKHYLVDTDPFFFIKQNDEIIAMPAGLENDLAVIQSALYIKKAGVKTGKIIRNELIPAHDLAVSSIVNPSINRLEVDKETALQYLRKADVSINTETRGWILLTHQHLPIGWIKAMPNRINNYYPKDWRILNK